MKQLNSYLNEALINKNTTIKKIINDISINDINLNNIFQCCIIEKTNDFKWVLEDDDNIHIAQLKIRKNPRKIKTKNLKNGFYSITFSWDDIVGRTAKFTGYYDPSIDSSFMWFVYEDGDPMYILFNTIEEAQNFRKNYKLYEKEIINTYKTYLDKNGITY